MGRSVNVPSGAQVVAYNFIEDLDDEFAYEDFVEWAREEMIAMAPSMWKVASWVGREGRAIARNRHAVFVISEYCGLVSLALVPEENALAERWCEQIRPRFEKAFMALRLTGRASNGEAFFERVA